MKPASFALSVLALLGLSGCAPDNVAACEAWVEHFNALSCVSADEQFDVAATCPETLNVGGLDCTAYYDCLTQNSQCDGDTLVFDDASCVGCL